ncbi:hypothetical protein SAMN05421810_101394 [Amycolatopsis arida]|uniref:DUF5709 domain-containing protein n=1 Tax=Amycolatopsis arida TaxID=587909 RepID=A0A1I5L3P7_9PSEU|nr:hypothetical protein [Amycolatopsis arida]TDX93572.1 hypothetical protein CLV69_10427 [Amycolatopsis arida]SFO91917.1 hypothetical protein SAMN05421810_101394 [Amycolatopsis arida]
MNDPIGDAVPHDRDDAHDPDAVETDPAALSSSEDLDQDRLRLDPLEEGVEPPENYAVGDRWGTTHMEQQYREPLEERVEQEQPDVRPPDVPERPIAATPADQLDQSVDDALPEEQRIAPGEEPLDLPTADAREEGRRADEAGGSVAEALRTPDREAE